jgi:acyl carrier protein
VRFPSPPRGIPLPSAPMVDMDAAGKPSLEARVSRLITEYAQTPPTGASPTALDHRLSLRGDLAIDSLALVSLTIRLGEEFNVDVVESGLEFGQLQTVGDLLAIAKKLQQR